MRSATAQAHGLEVARARLSDDVELGRAVKGAQALYAILPDDFRAEAFHASRRAMAEAMTRAIRREGVGRVVLVSSAAAVLGEGGNGFGAVLAYFERLLSDTNAAVTILRASYFQDNALMALPPAQQDGVYPNFFATRDRPLTTVAACDVGKIAAAALLEPPRARREVVDLVGPAYSAEQMSALLAESIGRPLSIVDVPREHSASRADSHSHSRNRRRRTWPYSAGWASAGRSHSSFEWLAELADRFEVRRAAHKRRQEIVSERVALLDLFERAQDRLP